MKAIAPAVVPREGVACAADRRNGDAAVARERSKFSATKAGLVALSGLRVDGAQPAFRVVVRRFVAPRPPNFHHCPAARLTESDAAGPPADHSRGPRSLEPGVSGLTAGKVGAVMTGGFR